MFNLHLCQTGPPLQRGLARGRWLELGRHVRKGEKGIAIIAPHTYRLKSKGEGDEEEFGLGFHIEHVFDVSQTDGDRIRSGTSPRTGSTIAQARLI